MLASPGCLSRCSWPDEWRRRLVERESGLQEAALLQGWRLAVQRGCRRQRGSQQRGWLGESRGWWSRGSRERGRRRGRRLLLRGRGAGDGGDLNLQG